MFALRTGPEPDPRFVIDDFEPAYLRVNRSGGLDERRRRGLAELEDCCACPRNCHVNRLENVARICHTGRHAIVSSALPHFGEEGCLRGWNGSGTIFFGMCNLRCVFCQNWDISQQRSGEERNREGDRKYADIDRQPLAAELAGARSAARRAGLSRFDYRW
jgi:putative pyruvate formate lyase activating enzyme